jgi:hypothetical protein
VLTLGTRSLARCDRPYGTVIEMICRLAVAEFDCACTVNGTVIEPPPPVPPPPLFVDPPQDASPVASAASSSINASGRAKAAAPCPWAPQWDDLCKRSPAAFRLRAITMAQNVIVPIAHIHTETMGMLFGVGPNRPVGSPAAAAMGFTETATFSITDALPFADMFSGFGLNVQVTPAGAPPHENAKEPATAFVDLTDKLNVAEPFTLMTVDTGETDAVTPLRLKTGGGGVSPCESPLSRMSALLPEFPSQAM